MLSTYNIRADCISYSMIIYEPDFIDNIKLNCQDIRDISSLSFRMLTSLSWKSFNFILIFSSYTPHNFSLKLLHITEFIISVLNWSFQIFCDPQSLI